MTYKTEAIILKKKNWGDYDRLFYFYTKDFGKKKALAKSVRKIKSKLNGHLQEFCQIDLFVTHGKTFDRIAGAHCHKSYKKIAINLSSINAGLAGMELAEQLPKEGQKDRLIYDLLLEFLVELNLQRNQQSFGLIFKIFALKFLSQLGYKLELYHCQNCQNKIDQLKNYFDYSAGLLCPDCGKNNKKCLAISKEAIKFLRFCLLQNLKTGLKVNLNKTLSKEINILINSYIRYHLDKELRVKIL